MHNTKGVLITVCQLCYYAFFCAAQNCPAGQFNKALQYNPTEIRQCTNCCNPMTNCWSPANPNQNDGDCYCNKGYDGRTFSPTYVNIVLVCTACAPGKYKDNTYHNNDCKNCPPDSTSSSTATDLASCLCNMGFDMGTASSTIYCNACTAGKYKDVPGPSACVNCAAGTYSSAYNAVSISTCQACWSNSFSVSGSTDCTCNAGFVRDGNNCFQCDTSNGDICSVCAVNTFRHTGSLICSECVMGKYRAASMATCALCPAGKTTNSAGNCESFPWCIPVKKWSNDFSRTIYHAEYNGANNGYQLSVSELVHSAPINNYAWSQEGALQYLISCQTRCMQRDTCRRIMVGMRQNGIYTCNLLSTDVPYSRAQADEALVPTNIQGARFYVYERCNENCLTTIPVSLTTPETCYCDATAGYYGPVDGQCKCLSGYVNPSTARMETYDPTKDADPITTGYTSTGTYTLSSRWQGSFALKIKSFVRARDRITCKLTQFTKSKYGWMTFRTLLKSFAIETTSVGQIFSYWEPTPAFTEVVFSSLNQYETMTFTYTVLWKIEASVCTPCGANTFAYLDPTYDSLSCKPCPARSVSKASSAVCKCAPGYNIADDPHTATGCTTQICPANEYMNPTLACQACPTYSSSLRASTNVLQCVCWFGYQRINNLCGPLTSIDLSNNDLRETDAQKFYNLVTLATLNLANNHITTLHQNMFDTLISMKTLNISSNKVTTLPATVFNSLVNLTTLDLSGNNLTVLPNNVFQKLSLLTTLNLSYNDLRTLKTQDLLPLASLQTLTLVGNVNLYTTLSAEILQRLSLLPGLKLCSDNWYFDATNKLCAICPPFSYTRITGLQLSDCICASGYEKKLTGECRVCATGYFSVGNNTQCVMCPAGTFQNQTNSSACLPCPSLQSSAPGSASAANCACTRGYMYNASVNGFCKACEAGKFKNIVSSTHACIPCPADSTTMPNATVRDECLCNAGFTNNRNAGVFVVCEACESGTYKKNIGSTPCQECEANSFKSVVGPGNCTSCTPRSTSPARSVERTNCVCDFGSTMDDNSTCPLCVPGKQASTRSNGTHVCENCEQGKWKSSSGLGNCTACSLYSTCSAGAVEVGACVCVGGYSRNYLNMCVVCDAGYFSTFVGFFRTIQNQADCSICPQNTYGALTGQENCTQCPSGTTTNTFQGMQSINSCVCTAGNTRDDGACVVCPTGKYKESPGDASCINCYYANSVPSTDRTTCVCQSGYYGFHGCTQCPILHTTSVLGSTTIANCQCDAGYSHIVVNGVTSCVLCAAGTYKIAASTSVCTLCEAGKYKVSSGVGSCVPCPAGQFSTQVGASSGTACQTCDAGKYSTSLNMKACVVCPSAYSASALTSAFGEGIMRYLCVDYINVGIYDGITI